MPRCALDWLPHFNRDLEMVRIPCKPLLDVERANNRGLALGLHLSEFYGVLCVLLFLELNGFGFLSHSLIIGLIVNN